MMGMLRMLATCRWSARRIQRYIDADPAGQLSARELHRLEAHLAVCERCTAAVDESRGIKSALARLADRRTPEPERVARLRVQAHRLAQGNLG